MALYVCHPKLQHTDTVAISCYTNNTRGGLLKTFFTKTKPYLCAFFIPILIFLFVFLLSYATTGNDTILFTDAGAQYIQFLTRYRSILLGNEDPIYNLTQVLGSSSIPSAAYYYLSPMNLIVVLFPPSAISICYFLITITKIGLAGLFMFIFLKSYGILKNPLRTKTLLILSASYALCSFTILYFWCFMWLDAILSVPLLCLSINRLIEGKSPLPYILVLSLNLISNYYMGYMLCIFSVIWFVYQYILQAKYRQADKFKIILRYIFASLLSAGLAAVILIPTFYSVFTNTMSVRTGTDLFQDVGDIRNTPIVLIKQIFLNSITGNVDYYIDTGIPALYIGAIMAVLTIFYFLNRNISKKERLLSLIVLGIFFVSLTFTQINLIWHGFSRENGLPFRYCYLISFFAVYLVFRELSFTSKNFINNPKLVKSFYIIQTIALMGNAFGEIDYLAKVNDYDIEEYYKPATASLVSSIKENDDSFYRIAFHKQPANDPTLYDYYSTSGFDSTTTQASIALEKNLGFSAVSNVSAGYGFGATAAARSFLGVKYVTYPISATTIKTNPDALTIGFIAASTSMPTDEITSPTDYENAIWRAISGEESDIYTEVKYKTLDNPTKDTDNLITINFVDEDKATRKKITDETAYYAVDYDASQDSLVFLCNTSSGLIESQDYVASYSLGSEHRVPCRFYRQDLSVLSDYSKKILSQPVQLSADTDSHITGTADVAADGQKLIFTITYDKGWHLFIDGEEVDIAPAFDALISADISSGHHTIELKFWPVGLTAGIIVSAASLIITVIYIIKLGNKRNQV